MLHLILFIFILALIKLSFVHWRRHHQLKPIQRWYRELDLIAHEAAFNELYQPVNGFQISQSARTQMDDFAFTYGEIEFCHFIALLSLAQPNEHTVFYDLGSGTGKAVIACTMVYPIRKSVGIEVLSPLHQTACQQKQRLQLNAHYAAAAEKIELRHADFLKTDLNDATLIFINATAFFSPLWEDLGARLQNIISLRTVITTSKPLNIPSFRIRIKTKVQMSWGIVTAFIHERY